MQIKCKTCGKLFITANSNGKYCSVACREEGRRKTRKEWEERTNYLEKKRLQAQAYREELAENRRRANIASANRRNAEYMARAADLEAKARADLEVAAAAGDYDAQMELAISGEVIDWRAYWKAYKAAEIAYAKEWNRDSTRTVNGVSVYEEHFEDKVMDAIQKQGRIVTTV